MTSLKGLYARPKRILATTEVEQPPPQKRRRRKKKNTKTSPPPPPSFTSLPDEIILNCLARISRTHYRLLSLVSKTIRSLLSSQDLYTVRSEMGNTEPCLYICSESPTIDQTLKTNGRIKDTFILSRIITPTSSASPPPKKSTFLAVGFEIYQMGGTINYDERPSSALRVLDCRTHTWRDAPDMTVARKRAKSAFIDGKIYVVGGTEESNNHAEVFDLKSQTWTPLPSLSDDDAKVGLYRGEIHKKYAYDPKQERWKEVLEFGFGPKAHTRGPWCVIENVKFSVFGDRLMWYDSERRNWFIVKGLQRLLYTKHDKTIQLASHGGKIVLVWDGLRSLQILVPREMHLCCGNRRRRRSVESPMVVKRAFLNKSIRCEVIKLEKRIRFSGLEICGEIVQSNAVLTVPHSYKFLSCMPV